ncbi:ABC transporter permease [Haloimpatiens sp. FM7315]|uniref:ABC transporter permease n=1 Tax=Haloimpatiens sp. FM7315 TaxID=3298609 RepID=UPI0035A3968A
MSTLNSILWQEYVLFRRKFFTITSSALVAPILYCIAFGWGLNDRVKVNGGSYMSFIIPGIIALTTMTSSYNNTANSINISRIFYKTFESYMIAPITMSSYAFAKIVAGALIGMYSGFLIVLVSLIFKAKLKITLYFVSIVFINCLVFSALGFTIGVIIKSHTDMSKFSNFVITPMSFLCGTFFSLDKLPYMLSKIVKILPLSQTSIALRSKGETFEEMFIHILILMIYFILFYVIGIKKCTKAE